VKRIRVLMTLVERSKEIVMNDHPIWTAMSRLSWPVTGLTSPPDHPIPPPIVEACERSSGSHTSGLWTVNPLNAQVDAPSGPVCQLLWPTLRRSEDETKANASLIAAAPELLELVQTIVRLADGRHWSGNLILDENSPLMGAARDLIAKTTGAAA
jgi:hypothetical protein